MYDSPLIFCTKPDLMMPKNTPEHLNHVQVTSYDPA